MGFFLALLFFSAVLFCLFFWEMCLLGRVPILSDIYFYWYPHLQYWIERVSAGELPLWNPYLKGGVPFFVDGVTGSLYPFHLFFLFLPYAQAQTLFYLVHFCAAFGGMYYCARKYRLSPWASLFAALVFTFSSYLVSMIHIFTKLRGLVWIPWVLGLVREGREQQKKQFFLAAGLLWALIVLGGHLYAAYFLSLFLVFELLWYEHRRAFRFIGAYTLLFVVGLGLSAPQWVPTVSFLPDSERKDELPKDQRDKWHLPLERLSEVLFPALHVRQIEQEVMGKIPFRKSWVDTVYFGFLPLFLAFWGLKTLFQKRERQHRWGRRDTLFWGGVLVGSLVLALGPVTPVWPWLSEILPLLDKFRYCQKFLFWTTLALGLLAGVGLEIWLGAFLPKAALTPKVLVSIVIPSCLCMIALSSVDSGGWWVRPLVLALVALPLLRFWRSALSPKLALVLVFAVTFGDLQSLLIQNVPTVPATVLQRVPKTLASLPKTTSHRPCISLYPFFGEGFPKFIRREARRQNWEFLEAATEELKRILFGNTTMIFGYPNPLGYATGSLWRYNIFFSVLSQRPDLIFELFGTEAILAHPARAPSWLTSECYEVRQTYPEDWLSWFWHKDPLPFVQWFPLQRVEYASSTKVAAQKLGRFQTPREQLVVEGEAPAFFSKGNPPQKRISSSLEKGSVQVLSQSPEELVVRVEAPQDGWILIRQSYCRGWTVENLSTNQSFEMYPANLLFQGIPVPAGRYTLRVRYTPPGWWLGWGIGGGTLVLLLLWGVGSIIWGRFRRRERP